MDQLPLPPLVKGHSIYGNLKSFTHDPLDFMLRCKKEYGDVARLNMGLMDLYLIFGSDEVEQAAQDKAFGRSDTAQLFSPLFGGSLIEADGELWKRQRRSASSPLTLQNLKGLSSYMGERADALFKRVQAKCEKEGSADIQQEVYLFTSELLAKTLFGFILDDNDTLTIVKEWTKSLEYMTTRLSSLYPLPMAVPTPNNIRLKRCAATIDRIIMSAVTKAISGDNKDNTYLARVLLETKDSEGKPLSKKNVFEEIRGIFLAAMDNTATGITWMIYYLATHPHVQDAIKKEFVSASKDNDDIAFQPMPYFESTLSESYRLSPPLWIVDRTTTSETTLGKYRIPKGSNIIMSPYVTHRDPRHWDDPLNFNPARFDVSEVNKRHKYAYYPFGVGRFKCPGIHMSLIENKILIYKLLKNNKFELCPWHLVNFDKGLVYRTGKLQIRLV